MANKHGGVHEHPAPTEATVKRLYANALWCAKPGCREPLYKTIAEEEKEELSSRVAHIHARRLGGPRWLPGMSSSANRGYKNLVILCLFDADAVDRREADFPAQMLRDWKQAREAEVRRLGGAKRPPLTDEQLAEVMALSFVPLVVDAVREVVPFSARSRTRAQALERARALSRARSLARLTPVPATLRERVLEWATASQMIDVAVPAGSVRIVVGPMGSGKSEIAESWWRAGLREAEHDDAIRRAERARRVRYAAATEHAAPRAFGAVGALEAEVEIATKGRARAAAQARPDLSPRARAPARGWHRARRSLP